MPQPSRRTRKKYRIPNELNLVRTRPAIPYRRAPRRTFWHVVTWLPRMLVGAFMWVLGGDRERRRPRPRRRGLLE